MAWGYRAPKIEEYQSEEEYEEAILAYEKAEGEYCEQQIEDYYTDKYNS